MFRSSRRKIILSIMGSLLLLFVITLSVILLASYRQIQKKSQDILRDYIERYSLEQEREPEQGQPDGPEPTGPRDAPPNNDTHDYQLAAFYSVAIAGDGTVLAVDTGFNGVYSEEELIRIAEDVCSGKKRSGRTQSLMYQVVPGKEYTLAAFMDNTVRDSTMHTLVQNVLIIGGIAMVVLFFISLVLSKQIILPLEENDRQQKQFISDASHELKTPVAVIGTNAELLSREVGENEWLANIQYENDRMGELVRQLLDLSRAENKDVPQEQVNFSRVVTGETLAFESVAFDHGKEIHSDIDEQIYVTGSQTQLTQLVSVLLDNAVRHSTGADIAVSLKVQGRTAVLNVTNDGKEIPAEKLEHLFDRFYRIDEARNSEGHHYGLGLSIAKAVAERHGGDIGVSCRDGKVSFSVSLPAKKAGTSRAIEKSN